MRNGEIEIRRFVSNMTCTTSWRFCFFKIALIARFPISCVFLNVLCITLTVNRSSR